MVADFLTEHLPKSFGVTSGLVVSTEGEFSNQADLLIIDHLHNAPMYGTRRSQLWPAEAVYAMIEVKASLDRDTLSDAVSKGRRFKRLARRFCDAPSGQRIHDSLFVIWGFDSPSVGTIKENLVTAIESIPLEEQPDLIVVPNRLVIRAGTYLETSTIGQPNSPFRASLKVQHGGEVAKLLPPPASIYDVGDNALMVWYIWLDSWLRQEGPRPADPIAYLPVDRVFGQQS